MLFPYLLTIHYRIRIHKLSILHTLVPSNTVYNVKCLTHAAVENGCLKVNSTQDTKLLSVFKITGNQDSAVPSNQL